MSITGSRLETATGEQYRFSLTSGVWRIHGLTSVYSGPTGTAAVEGADKAAGRLVQGEAEGQGRQGTRG